MEGGTGMNYNLILYIGLVFYVLIFVLFITNEMDKRKKDRAQWLSDQLTKSFEEGKKNEKR
jgi:hypothetical protein